MNSLSYAFSFGHIQHLAREAPFRNVKRKVWGWEFFLQVFFGIILLCRIFLGSGYFFRYPFQYRIFLFCRIFPFFLFFVIPPPFQTDTKRFGEGERTFPMGEGGVLALNRTEGSEVFFTPPVFFLSQEMSCFSWGLKRIRKFWGGLHTCKGKIITQIF